MSFKRQENGLSKYVIYIAAPSLDAEYHVIEICFPYSF